MTKLDPDLKDAQLDQILANLLRTGVILVAIVVVVGGIIFLYHHGNMIPELKVFHGEPSFLRTVPAILQADRGLRSRAIIQLGILLLIFTPIARVAFCLLTFARQGDHIYTMLTFIVLVVLLHSFMIAF